MAAATPTKPNSPLPPPPFQRLLHGVAALWRGLVRLTKQAYGWCRDQLGDVRCPADERQQRRRARAERKQRIKQVKRQLRGLEPAEAA